MRKVMISALVVLTLVSLLSVPAFAVNLSIGLVGKWEGTMSGVKYDPSGSGYQYYKDVAITIRILNQAGDRFYGEIITGGDTEKFVGVIAGGKGVISGTGFVVFADMPVLEDSKYRIFGHGQGSSPDGYMEASKFAVHRTSTTP